MIPLLPVMIRTQMRPEGGASGTKYGESVWRRGKFGMSRNGFHLGKGRLWAEFLALFLGVPMVLAFALPPTAMFTVLGVTCVIGIVLLHRTPGFTWGSLLGGRIPWVFLLGFTVITGAVAVGVTVLLLPENLFWLPRRVPGIWLNIMLLYPIVSALPQELLFRPLFFARYGTLFPDGRVALAVNAVVFAFAHLMYMHPVVWGMTLVGGYVFGWLYLRRESFIAAVIAHAVAGQLIFTSGLGALFYSGGVN